jgi:hypothetical protein
MYAENTGSPTDVALARVVTAGISDVLLQGHQASGRQFPLF